MASGDVGQDELIEILENLFKAMNKKRAIEKQKKQNSHGQGANGHLRAIQLKEKERELNALLEPEKQSSKNEKKVVLPEERLSKEEALTYLQAYSDNIDLDKFEFSSNFLDDKTVSINYVEKGNKQNPVRYSLNFDLETNQGTITNSYLGERKGNFETVTDIDKRFSKDELIQKYNDLNPDKKRESIKNNVGEKVSLVDSMTSYATTLDLKGYHLSSKSITENKAMIFFKHKENPGDVKEISYNPKTETGKLTHLLSNKENDYSNQKTILNEYDKTDLERHGFGKTAEEIEIERESQRVDTGDTREEFETDYDEKVLDSRLGKSVTKQVLSDAELLKGAFALYQLTSMRKLLANSKDQVENLNSLLNKKDVNFDKIINVKDNLLEQIDVLQTKVSALEKNQDTTQTFDKLNDGYKKDQDEAYEKSNENKPTKVVETEHSM